MFALLPHPFLLHPNHLYYLTAFTLLIFCLSLASTILRVFFPKAPYSLLLVFLWSLLLTLCFAGDYFRLTAKQFALATITGGLFFGLLFTWKLKTLNCNLLFKLFLESNSLRELIYTFTLWITGLFILLIPLAFGFPENTLVTGHFICNDSVVHSIMAQGISFIESRKIDPFYYSAAPRGIHSFTYYFHSLFKQIPTSRIILPTAIASYSLTVLSADFMLRALGVRPIFRFLSALLPVCAFLPVAAIYAIFLGQVAAVASTFAALGILFYLSRFGTFKEGLLFFAVFALGAVSTYGLFSLSLIGFGVFVAITLEVIESASFAKLTKQTKFLISIFYSPTALGIAIGILLLAYPSIQFALYVIRAQGAGTVASDLTSAIGNLPEGYLSPLHLSGVWPPGIGYREQLTGVSSAFGSALIFLIAIQVYLVGQLPIRGIFFLLTLAIPCFATTILIKSPYVHFKFFTFLIPGFLVLAGAGLDQLRNTIIKSRPVLGKLAVSPLGFISLLGLEGLCVFMPLPTATIIPMLSEAHFASFESLWGTLEGKRSMVLTKEDWLQFGAQVDDYVPMIIYIPQRFNGEPLDAVVVDRAYKKESLEYLQQFPKLLLLVQDHDCMTVIADRFEIYPTSCKQ